MYIAMYCFYGSRPLVLEPPTSVMPEESNVTWALHFNPDGRLLASAHANVIALWDSASGRQLATLPGSEFGAVRFSPDGRTLFTSGAAGVERRAVHLQAGPTFDTIHLGPPETIAAQVTGTTTSLTDDGRLLVLSDNNGARVLNLKDYPMRKSSCAPGKTSPPPPRSVPREIGLPSVALALLKSGTPEATSFNAPFRSG